MDQKYQIEEFRQQHPKMFGFPDQQDGEICVTDVNAAECEALLKFYQTDGLCPNARLGKIASYQEFQTEGGLESNYPFYPIFVPAEEYFKAKENPKVKNNIVTIDSYLY
jgi:hypothetical protein